jgi:predicted HTH domain antitoxin
MKEKLTTIRLDLAIDRELEQLAKLKDTDKSKLIRDLILLGIREKKLQEALKLYAQGRVTLWKAATLSGLSVWEMMEIIAERKIPMPYGIRELEEDLKGLKD